MSHLSPLLVVDLIGIAVFAASGASAGVAKRLDLFGVVFVGFTAALGGGIMRDLFINVQPFAFVDWRYAAVAAVTAGATFRLHPTVSRLHWTVLVLDAAGLGLFTVTGTLKALDAGIPPVGACIIGMITGIGGGLVRDLLTGEIPTVLRREIYAVAGLLGCASVAALDALRMQRPVSIALAATLVFALRMVALRRNWSAPTAVNLTSGGRNGRDDGAMSGFASLIMVNIDCAEPPLLATFYSEVLGWEVTHSQAEYAMISDGTTSLGFGQLPGHTAPTWPEGPVPKQFHLDFYVEDLADAEARALKLGASKPEFQPAPERYVVLQDPAGHPLCLCLRS